MSYILRPYQQAAVSAGLAYLTDPKLRGRHGIIVQPTGAGKSLVIANLVQALDAPALVFQPSREILQQNAEKLAAYGYRPAIFSASLDRREVGQITLATIGSVVTTPEAFAHVKYVLIDECHSALSPKSGEYLEFLSQLEGVRVLGLTATPFRLASNSLGSELRFLTRTRPRVFTDVVHVTQVQDLVVGGFWAPLVYEERLLLPRAKLKPNSTGADFSDKSVQQAFAACGFVGRLCDEVQRQLDAGRRHVLVFTRFVEEAQQLAATIPGAACVTANTPPGVRAQVVTDFRRGRLRVVANVGVLGLGFDFPELDCVMLARPTMSLSVHYQQIGRAVRPHPDKAVAHIVDLVGTVAQFGKVEDLVVTRSVTGLWTVCAGGRPLTNVAFEQTAGLNPAAIVKARKRRQFWAKRAAKKGGRPWRQ